MPSEPPSTTQAPDTDHVLRALTDDGAFRVVVVRTTETVRGVLAAQRASHDVAPLFSDLITASILVRETMSPDLRVQAILEAGKAGRMVADAQPDGMTRGLLQLPEGAPGFRLAGSHLQIARRLHNGALHQGVVEAPSGGGISGALMEYMQSSEQVLSMVAVGTHFEGGEVKAAGGYVLQLLPEVGKGPLMVMTERLRDFESIDHLLAKGEASPRELMGELLYGMDFTEVGEGRVRFGCNCSHERVLATLATLPRNDIEELLSKGEVLEIACDYCRRDYRIGPEALRGLVGDAN